MPITAIARQISRLLLTTLILAGSARTNAQIRRQFIPQATAQSRVALDFLARLESAQLPEAYDLLDPELRQTYSIDRLNAAAKSLTASRLSHRISFEGQAFVPNRATSMPTMQRPSYVVCIVNAPASGYGTVTYAAMFLRINSVIQAWRITDYRIDAEPHPSCRR